MHARMHTCFPARIDRRAESQLATRVDRCETRKWRINARKRVRESISSVDDVSSRSRIPSFRRFLIFQWLWIFICMNLSRETRQEYPEMKSWEIFLRKMHAIFFSVFHWIVTLKDPTCRCCRTELRAFIRTMLLRCINKNADLLTPRKNARARESGRLRKKTLRNARVKFVNFVS